MRRGGGKRGGRGGATPRQNGSAGHSRDDRGDEDSMPVGGLEEEDDPALRREIRSKYRELINSVQEDREAMLSPANNKLTEVLEEANKLFKDVSQAREAALDTQLLVVTADLCKEKASQLFVEGSAFDPSAFAEHLLNFMGLNRLENEDEDEENGVAADGYLPQDAWHRVAKRAQCCFKTAPTFHYMMGSFLEEPPPPKQRVERQRKAPTKETQRTMPAQLKKMEESHQEATEKEVERILGFLTTYHAEDPTSPISYYEFVIDPESFSHTVENMFHTSFLLRDGMARMYLDANKLPCIAPVTSGESDKGESALRKQCIMSISMQSWRDLIEAFEITAPMIPANTQSVE